jgi:hypothetical protein
VSGLGLGKLEVGLLHSLCILLRLSLTCLFPLPSFLFSLQAGLWAGGEGLPMQVAAYFDFAGVPLVGCYSVSACSGIASLSNPAEVGLYK